MLSAAKEIISEILYIFTKKQKRQSCIIIVLIVIGAIFETLGVSAILPFIQALLMPEKMMEYPVILDIGGLLGINSQQGILLLVSFGVIMIYVLKNAYLICSSYIQVNFRFQLQKSVAVTLLKSYMKMPYAYFLNINSSEIHRGVIGDVTSVSALTNNFFMLSKEVFAILMIAVFLIITDPFMAIGIFVLAGACFLTIGLGTRKKIARMGGILREVNAEQLKYVTQSLNGIKELSVMQKRSFFVDKYDKAYDRKNKADVTYGFTMEYPTRLIEAICVAGFIGVVLLRIWGGVNIAEFIAKLAAFAVAAFRILPSISAISQYMTGIVYYQPSLHDVYQNIKKANEYDAGCLGQSHIGMDKLQPETKFLNAITFNNISWKYNEKLDWVLNNLSMEVHKNESIAIIGASGAGKTTLIDMLLGLYRPIKGEILVDGTNIFEISGQWSKMVAYIPQSVYLIDDTIANNVAFGIEEDQISEDRIWSALEQAQLKSFVESLEESIYTKVGERGIRLSGGQRQRIAIARALYNNPDVLVMDEATSALDTETETAVMQAIECLQGHKTLIIVAHRMSTIRNCDRIYEIKKGVAALRRKEDIFNSSK